MDNYYSEFIGTLEKDNSSWHAFKYKLPTQYYNELLRDKSKIMERAWKMQVKFQPDLSDKKTWFFLQDELPLNHYRCFSVADRLDILPDGSVSSCKHFPEMVVGNLKDGSVSDIWHNEKYSEIREAIQNQLMPVCTKCNNLYLHGKKCIYEK
ncbi:MAG: SPASM domain-containing protein [Dysgonamonadaceae bacterium]|nr:SPASM domain-containing protein [Dysgonamonadaceae bacterium]